MSGPAPLLLSREDLLALMVAARTHASQCRMVVEMGGSPWESAEFAEARLVVAQATAEYYEFLGRAFERFVAKMPEKTEAYLSQDIPEVA